MKRVLLTLVGFSLALAGCNTVRGVGQDIESVADTGEQIIN
jgi:predicted small secreted protein